MNTPLKEVTDIKLLRETVKYLYNLLDNISTIDDQAKDNDVWFRLQALKQQTKKSIYIESNGYDLFLAPDAVEREQIQMLATEWFSTL